MMVSPMRNPEEEFLMTEKNHQKELQLSRSASQADSGQSALRKCADVTQETESHVVDKMI